MNHVTLCFIAFFAAPIIGIGLCLLATNSKTILQISVGVALAECAVTFYAFLCGAAKQRIFAFGNNLFMDALSIYHISLVVLVFLAASVYAQSYFSRDIDKGKFNCARARQFGMLWNGFFMLLLAVLCANNMGLLWICLEATTLVSALLILTNRHPLSIEAMWKYLILCSIGIALAFVGTLLVSVASHAAGMPPDQALLWTALNDHASILDKHIMFAAFIFLVVGFGTKAGLAPMHTWLPDAHSQAPTPVSAVFSGVMLNCAIYCLLRYLPVCEGSVAHPARLHAILILFGLLSIFVAAVFIPSQKNIKRLLAYCSVEHIGIITLGIGIGGLGTIAALFHTFNHSMSKCLAFFSAGRLARQYGTYDMAGITGACSANKLWGTSLLIALLSLFGAAPFSIFASEIFIVKSAIASGRYVSMVVFLVCSIIVFVAAIRRAIDMCAGKPDSSAGKSVIFWRDYVLVISLVGTMLMFGVAMPHWYKTILVNAATIADATAGLTGVLK